MYTCSNGKQIRITQIVATDLEMQIGFENQLLWHIPEDLAYFNKNTKNKTCIVGYNTLLSIPKKLGNRLVALIASPGKSLDTKAIVNSDRIYHSFEDAMEDLGCKANDGDEFMIIGGSKIYDATAQYTDTILLTEVDMVAHYADTKFNYDLNLFNITSATDWLTSSKSDALKYRFLTLQRDENPDGNLC